MLQQGGFAEQELLGGYATEAMALMENMPSNRGQLEMLITAFFRNRGEVLQGKKWEATDEWTDEDTRMLPKLIIEQVETFMAMEESAGVVEEERQEEGEEEAKN